MIQKFWNDSVYGDERQLVPRSYSYASELGGSMIDRYLKMKATPVTNPPNKRALRKMMAGNFTEAIILYIFQRAGILTHSQRKFETTWTPIPVHGKSDIIIGGRPNIDQARKAAEQFDFHPNMHAISMKVIEQMFDKEYPETIYEVKSIATFKADSFERLGDKAKPVPQHELQLGLYVLDGLYSHGILSYVCRDDLRMTEFYVHNTEDLKSRIIKDTATLKGYIDANQLPPLEKYILFEDGKFSKNLQVEYSSYLTLLYGFGDSREYSEMVGKIVPKWNRVLKRYKEGEKITDKNKEVAQEINDSGFDFDTILANFVPEKEEEETS